MSFIFTEDRAKGMKIEYRCAFFDLNHSLILNHAQKMQVSV